jgi:hypothetical protein
MAAQPFKIVRVAIKPIVSISLKKTLIRAETLVDASHGDIAKILKVILGPHLVLGRLALKHLVILGTLLSKVKNKVSIVEDIRQISNTKTYHRCVKKKNNDWESKVCFFPIMIFPD